MWQDSSNPYGASSSQNAYYAQQLAPQDTPLQFYSPGPAAGGSDANGFYPGSRPSLDGQLGPQGTISQQGPGYGGNIQVVGGWWTAFGTGGFEGEPPLMQGAKTYSLWYFVLTYSRVVNQ